MKKFTLCLTLLMLLLCAGCGTAPASGDPAAGTHGKLYYNGKSVRLLWDSRSREASPAESEKPGLDSFSNWDAKGEIDLYAVRDFSRNDPDGYGTLTGLRVASQEEFDANTGLFTQRGGAVESAA